MLQFSAKVLNPPVSAKLSRNKFILYPLKIVEIKYKLVNLAIHANLVLQDQMANGKYGVYERRGIL